MTRSFDDLLAHLRTTRGFDFSAYKQPSLMRRIERRMQVVKVPSFDEYLDYLEVHPDEFTSLFNMILINVTSFFRDAPSWQILEDEVVPAIVARKEKDGSIRVWSAGCASGEEAYSMAMLLAEALGLEDAKRRVKIYATDIDDEALAEGRQASYAARSVESSVPAPLVERYFERRGDTFQISKDLRRLVIFGRHDLLRDAPVSRLSMTICRNCLMYMNADAQSRILQSLHFGLEPDGILFLGKAEMLFSRQDLFRPIDLRRRIFAKIGQSLLPSRAFNVHAATELHSLARHLESPRLRALAFDTDAVPQIAVDPSGALALANDRARMLLRLSEHEIGRPVKELEIAHRPFAVSALVERALTQRYSFTEPDIEVRSSPDDVSHYDVHVTALIDVAGEVQGVSIAFRDVSRFHLLQDALKHSHHELETAYEEIQSTNEELETTNEELQSTNEELETTNEELQSTNEELETMNEELQSVNEELHTANEELRTRSDDLNGANAFLEAFLSSLSDGIIVLDDQLRVLAWNLRSEDLWGVRAGEAKGQDFLSFDIGLPVVALGPTIRAAMSDGHSASVLMPAVNRRGKSIEVRVTASKLASFGDFGNGGVVLLVDEIGRKVDGATVKPGFLIGREKAGEKPASH